MLKEAFGDNALGLIQTYEWFQRFKADGYQSTMTTENVAKVRDAILEDRRRTIYDVYDIACMYVSVGTEEATKIPVGIDSFPVYVRTEHLPNTGLGFCRYVKLLGPPSFFWKPKVHCRSNQGSIHQPIVQTSAFSPCFIEIKSGGDFSVPRR
jgi:hypothetical protein